MKFEYDDTPQRTAVWLDNKRGKIGASSLWRWLSVSKSKATPGAPLKERLDYEKELMFERQFGVSFDRFVTPAMQDGIDYEDFARKQYEKITKNSVAECGCWYNDYFVASPDGLVGNDGLVEIKVLKDNSFTDVLTTGVIHKHYIQIQGQLWASGRKWCDYVAINLNTRKLKIIRIVPDPAFHAILEEAVVQPLSVIEFDASGVYDFADELPNWEELDD